MSRPRLDAPRCLSCSNRLRRRTRRFGLDPCGYDYGDPPAGATIVREPVPGARGRTGSYHVGWGDYADGFFCGLRCGHRYGKKMAALDFADLLRIKR